LLLLIVAIGLTALVGAPVRAADIPGGRYGEVHVNEPANAMRGLVILFSDLSGWSEADRKAAELLARHDMLVVGVDTIAGAVSIDPPAAIDARFHPCPHDPTIMHDPGLPGFWSIGATKDVPAETQTVVSTLRKLNTKVDVRSFASGTAETEMLLPLAQPRLESRVSNEGRCVRSTADRAAGGVSQ
jgi:hypothetical protein